MRKFTLLLVLLLFLTGCGQVPEDLFTEKYLVREQSDLPKFESYSILPRETTVLWDTNTLTGESRSGFVAMDRGLITIDDRQVTSSTILFDMKTFTVARGPINLHVYMNDYDYFDTFYYPDAKFSLRSIRDLGNETFRLSGVLELVEITRQIQFDAQLFKSRNYLGIQGDFIVDVIQWGIVQNQSTYYQDLGTDRIEDELHFTVEWVFEEN